MPLTSGEEQQRQLFQILDRAQVATEQTVLQGVGAMQDSIIMSDLERAMLLQSANAAEDAIALDLFVGQLDEELPGQIAAAADEAADVSLTHLPDNAVRGTTEAFASMKIDVLSPLIQQFAATTSAELVTNIDESTRLGIRRIITDTLDVGLPPRSAAIQIRDRVGMTARQAAANERLRANLVARGTAPAEVERITNRHAARSIRVRAETISRTEMMDSISFGREEMWSQGARTGLIDSANVERQWLTAQDERVDCQVCKPTHGQRRALGEPFILGDDRAVMRPGRNVHPNDRCTVVIVRPR